MSDLTEEQKILNTLLQTYCKEKCFVTPECEKDCKVYKLYLKLQDKIKQDKGNHIPQIDYLDFEGMR